MLFTSFQKAYLLIIYIKIIKIKIIGKNIKVPFKKIKKVNCFNIYKKKLCIKKVSIQIKNTR